MFALTFSNHGPRRRRLTTSLAVVAAAFAIAGALLPRPTEASMIITIGPQGPEGPIGGEEADGE